MTAPSGKRPEIRLATPSDATAIAELWAVCQPDSVWSRVGPRLASRHFAAYCDGGHELAVTARVGGDLVGACLGTDRPTDHGRAARAGHRAELAKAFAREAVTRPGVAMVVLGRVARGILGRVGIGTAARGPRPADMLSELAVPPERASHMSDFFVSPSARGRQLGTRMLERFWEEMERRGRQVCIVHTTVDNVESQVAQRRAGFECVLEQGPDLTFVRRAER